MGTINQVMLLGHLGADPEFHTTTTGLSRCRLSLATHHRRADQQTDPVVTWHHVKLWRHNAEIARDHLKKGDAVAVSGRIVHEEWTDQRGQEHKRTVIVADRLTLVLKRAQNKPQEAR